jgi:DNA-binding response OmpR family regulator
MKNFKILVVDDDELTRMAYKNILELYDFDVFESSNGLDAIRLTKEINPDIIILDLVMTGISGFDVLDEINKIRKENNYDGFILVSSVSTAFKDIAKALKSGAEDFIFKHYEWEHIRYRIIVSITKLLLRRDMLPEDL